MSAVIKNIRVQRVMIAAALIFSILMLQQLSNDKDTNFSPKIDSVDHVKSQDDVTLSKNSLAKIHDKTFVQTPKHEQTLNRLPVARFENALPASDVPESVKNFREIISANCLDCFIVESTVNEMISDSCHIPLSMDLLRDTMASNPMYIFLLVLKTQNETIFNEYLTSARNTVDCEDSYQWLNKSKQLFSAFHPPK